MAVKIKGLSAMDIDLCSCVSNSENFFIPSSEQGNIFVSKCCVPSSVGTVIIVPPYGRTVHDSFLITANLLVNGFDVIRFDCRNHVGLSTGDIEHYKMSSIEMDLMDILKVDFIELSKPLIVMGISLSAPVAWKMASKIPNISGVVTLVGAVDIVSTIEIAGEFSLTPYLDPMPKGDYYQEILGFRIIGQPFVDDLVAYKYTSLMDIKNYISKAPCPVYMISASDDSWVSLEQVKQIIDLNQENRALRVLENSDHELGKSAVVAKKAAIFLVEYCKKILGNQEEVVVPSLTKIIKASTLESEKFSQLEPELLSLEAIIKSEVCVTEL